MTTLFGMQKETTDDHRMRCRTGLSRPYRLGVPLSVKDERLAARLLIRSAVATAAAILAPKETAEFLRQLSAQWQPLEKAEKPPIGRVLP